MFIVIIASVWLLDQITKWLVIEYLEPYQKVIKITPFLNLVPVRNTGVAFGLFAGKGKETQIFLMVFTLIAIVILLYFYFNPNRSGLKTWACGLVIGGAFGNLINRLLYKNVVDFIDCHLGKYHWPVFNIADSAISVGMLLLLWYFYKEKR
jgi:signal peptidase II